jgi:antitoxin component YwqK of YwqJK toxin-antitoxin module
MIFYNIVNFYPKMKKIIVYSILSMINSICYGQSQINVEVISKTRCDRNTDTEKIQNRIINKTFKNDTLRVVIGIIVNCGGISNVRANFTNDTINFTFEDGRVEYDTIVKKGKKIPRSLIVQTKCDCYFEFEFMAYKVSKEPEFISFNGEEFKYFAEKYKIYPVKYDIAGVDTINLSDRYGSKQGKWTKTENSRITINDKYKFEGFYVDNEIKSLDFTIFNKVGRIKYKEEKRGFDTTKIVSYYESGQIEYESTQNGANGGSITHHFYENGLNSRIYTDNHSVRTEQLFYKDGKLKKLTTLPDPVIWREYYPNGILKYERLYSKNKDNIWAKYFYNNGKVMSVFYIKSSKKKNGESYSWGTYFDLKGNRIPKQSLIKAGWIVD